MLIRVMYQDDTYDMVQPSILDQLISSNTIKKFFRSGGWADIEEDPIRGSGGSGNSYEGPDRRSESNLHEMQD
ncbi:MAG: GSU3473 family protein [bacterium]